MNLLRAPTSPRAKGAPRRRELSDRTAYYLAASVIGLALFASGTPSPLYGVYQEMWGFSAATLTLVFATYAFGVLVSLVLAGRISDELGRRPVLIAALAVLTLVTIPFMFAESVVWLFVARGLQGLATGLALAAASAALLDLHPRRDPVAVGITNGIASMAGLGLGVLVSATLIELLPAPRVLPYVLSMLLFATALWLAWRMPEPVEVRPGARLHLTPQRPRVPAAVRRPFALAALCVISSWSIGGIFFSLGPQLSGVVFHSSSHIVAGLVLFILGASGAVAQLAFGRVTPWAGVSAGSLLLATGMALIVVAASTESAPLLIVGAVVAGAGFGLAFLSGLRSLSAVIPTEHRAEVMSAFYVVAYLSLSLPAVAAGFAVGSLGLERTFEIAGSAIVALAVAVALEAWRTRPSRTAPLAYEAG